MKKASLLLFSVITLSVFTTPFVCAQSATAYDKLKFGVKGGLNVTSVNDDDRVPDDLVTSRLGFHLGVLAHYHLSEKWALQPEVLYSKEGAKYDWPGFQKYGEYNGKKIGPYMGKTDLNFVQVPILVQYMIGPGFRIQTGPQAGLIINANFEDENNNERRKLDIQRVNVSWVFGLGYLHKSGFGLDARYNMGILNIYPSELYPGESAYTQAGQFGVFYQFNSKR